MFKNLNINSFSLRVCLSHRLYAVLLKRDGAGELTIPRGGRQNVAVLLNHTRERVSISEGSCTPLASYGAVLAKYVGHVSSLHHVTGPAYAPLRALSATHGDLPCVPGCMLYTFALAFLVRS